MARGKFIVLYGINNLGKTTQARQLVGRLNKAGRKAKYLKYPVYDLPSGERINKYLRGGNPENLSAKEAQILYAENRREYEPTLVADLENGFDVVTEDYWGTGVAWGMGAGVDKDFLLEINKDFLREDLALLFVGERFAAGIEGNHRHEQDVELTKKVETAHRELGQQFGWKVINANQSVEEVSKQVWQCVNTLIY